MATKTEDETTVQFVTENGSSEPMSMTEFEQTTEEALDRVRGGHQLSFDVGGREPNRASVKASMDVLIPHELTKGSQVFVSVTTTDGEVLARTPGKVTGVHFDDEYDKDGFLVGTERVHKVKLAG